MKTKRFIVLIISSIILLMGCGKINSVQKTTNYCTDMADSFNNSTEKGIVYDDKLGLNLSVVDISPTGCKLVFSQSGNQSTGILKTGSYYKLEQYDGENWFMVIPIIKEYGWDLQALTINKNQDTEFIIEWEWLYGKLGPGTYRLGKEVMDIRESGSKDEYFYYVEFEINESQTT